MDMLFTTDIINNGQNKLYNVHFRDEQYVFEPEDGTGETFGFRREDDTWKPSGTLPDIAQQQAIAALDRYLLSQH